jgi:hypothetical protein
MSLALFFQQGRKIAFSIFRCSSACVSVSRPPRTKLQDQPVPPKYRGPSGETWAGRGAKPHWLAAAIKGGKKLDDFLIDKRHEGDGESYAEKSRQPFSATP